MLERVMIIAGESSGELYGALLARELKKRHREISITGMGGEKMAAAGVELISGITASFGLTEVFKTLLETQKTFQKILTAIKTLRPQVLVLIDYPDFNMRIAQAVKGQGAAILYYVSPQVWAWRKNRINTLKRIIHKMALILPFEEKLYHDAGVECEFVGHPIIDEITEVLAGAGFAVPQIGSEELKQTFRKKLGLDPAKATMALMPGSRRHEILKLMPVIIDSMNDARIRDRGFQFVMPVAPNLNPEVRAEMLGMLKLFSAGQLIIVENSIEALLSADASVIASGTSTLQAAVLRVPMVVMYKVSAFSYFVGRLVVKIQHFSLANVILDFMQKDGIRIKELLQADASSENVCAELSRILDDKAYENELQAQFKVVADYFIDKSASGKVALMVEELEARNYV
ncbi:MAG: lipid-A-disaccharide synthase [Nitrospirae bacterium]|nr:lipid-A-disaccharide synthase [Nitrospirota bacterium]